MEIKIKPKISIQKLQASLIGGEYSSLPHSIRHKFEKCREGYPNSVLGRYWQCGYFIMGGMSGPILYADKPIKVFCDDGLVLEPLETYETYQEMPMGWEGINGIAGYTGAPTSSGGFQNYIEEKLGEGGVEGEPKEIPKEVFTQLPKRRINWD